MYALIQKIEFSTCRLTTAMNLTALTSILPLQLLSVQGGYVTYQSDADTGGPTACRNHDSLIKIALTIIRP